MKETVIIIIYTVFSISSEWYRTLYICIGIVPPNQIMIKIHLSSLKN